MVPVVIVVAQGCRHDSVAETLLGALVVVVVVAVCGLLVGRVAMVPASQVLSHSGLLKVPRDLGFAAGSRAVPGWPKRGVRVLRRGVELIVAIATMHIIGTIGCVGRTVWRIDAVVSLRLIVVHADAIRVRLWLHMGRIARNVEGSSGGSSAGPVGVAVGLRLSQVGHAACVGVYVFPVAAAHSTSLIVVPGNCILHAGLAGVGRAVIEYLGAVAAPGWGQVERGQRRFGFQ